MTIDDSEIKLKVGYVRVSTEDQDPQHQIRPILDLGIPPDLIFVDHGVSGRKHPMKRAGYQKMNSLIEKGLVSTIYVVEFSRLGRDTLTTLDTLIDLWNRGIEVVPLSDSDSRIMTMDPLMRPLMISALQIGADLERRHIAERTKAGLETARLRGVKIGRKKIPVDRKKLEADMQKYGISMNMAAKINGIKPSTLTRAKREWKEEGCAVGYDKKAQS